MELLQFVKREVHLAQNSPPGPVALVCNWPNMCATPVIGPRWLHSDSLNGCTASPLPLAPSATHLALLLLGSKTPISLVRCTHTHTVVHNWADLMAQLQTNLIHVHLIIVNLCTPHWCAVVDGPKHLFGVITHQNSDHTNIHGHQALPAKKGIFVLAFIPRS